MATVANVLQNLHPIVLAILTLLGAASALLTAVAAICPPSWAITQWCARFGADLRAVAAKGQALESKVFPEKRGFARLGAMIALAIAALAILLLPLAVSGCAWIKSEGPAIDRDLAKALNAANDVDIVQHASDEFFARHPNPSGQAKVNDGIQRTRQTIDLLSRIQSGGHEIAGKDAVDAARDFVVAWGDLQNLLRAFGVTSGASGDGGVGAGIVVDVPTPELVVEARR